jgi:hypothetical protein
LTRSVRGPGSHIVAAAAGSATDITARLIGQWLTERLGQSFFVEGAPEWRARDEAASILVMGGRRGSHVVAANTFDAMFLVGGYFARNREPAIEGKLGD